MALLTSMAQSTPWFRVLLEPAGLLFDLSGWQQQRNNRAVQKTGLVPPSQKLIENMNWDE